MRIPHWSRIDRKWYLGVLCGKCEEPILFGRDHSNGEVTLTPMGRTLVLTCSLDECQHQADYSGAAVSRFQKQPNMAGIDGIP